VVCRTLKTFCALTTGLCVTLVAAGAVAQKARYQPYGQAIAALEALANPANAELEQLAINHMCLGDLYASMATCASHLTIRAAQCYSDDTTVAWGAEYFGALASLELGRRQGVEEFVKREETHGMPPAALASLLRVVESLAKADMSDSRALIKMLTGAGYCDSMEVACRAVDAVTFDRLAPKIRAVSRDGNVELAPLTLRLRLTSALLHNRTDSLRRLLASIERTGLPLWRIETERGAPEFGDPALLAVCGRAHYRMAQDAFSRVQGGGTAASADLLLKKRVELCFRTGDFRQADALLAKADPGGNLAPFAGWVAWMKGDKERAAQLWRPCEEIKDYRRAAALLAVWAGIAEYRGKADQLRASLVSPACLGSMMDRAKAAQTSTGSTKLWTIYRSVGASYMARGVFDSANFAYQSSRPSSYDLQVAGSLDDTYRGEYFMAGAVSGAVDFRQEAYLGWKGMMVAYPGASGVVAPLSMVISCESRNLAQ